MPRARACGSAAIAAHSAIKYIIAINARQISTDIESDQSLRELDKALDRTAGGEVVEFGCYVGTASLFIRRLLDERREEREIHVYDSFKGLPPKTREDDSPAGLQFKAGELSVSKKQFLQEFKKANLRPPIIHKGWFSDLTEQDVPKQIAFAFLDGDFYESIRVSLRLVLPRLVPGATIIFDDYAREALPGVAVAVHELLPSAKIKVENNLGILIHHS